MNSPGTPHVPVIPPPRFFFAVSLGLAVCFAIWSWVARTEEAGPAAEKMIPALDWRCAVSWHDWTQTNHSLWDFMVFLTDLGGIAAMTLLAIMGAIWQTALKHRFLAIAWLGVVSGGGLLNLATKFSFDRDRPPATVRDRAVLETNKSYPSGHSMGSAIGYGMLGYALILPQRRRPRRMVTLIVMSATVLAIGFSRVYLRAHWFSDVVGGWTIGLTWLFFCLGLLEFRRRAKSEW